MSKKERDELRAKFSAKKPNGQTKNKQRPQPKKQGN